MQLLPWTRGIRERRNARPNLQFSGALGQALGRNLCNASPLAKGTQRFRRNSIGYTVFPAHALSQDERSSDAAERQPEHPSGVGAAFRFPEAAALARASPPVHA